MMKTETSACHRKIVFFQMFFLILSLLLGHGLIHSQPAQQELTSRDIELEEIIFRVREIPSSPVPLRLIEIQISVFNRSQRVTVPPDSLKIAIVPKEVAFLSTPPKDDSSLRPQTVTLNASLLPRTGRILVISFSLPSDCAATLAIHDESGRLVRTLLGGKTLPAGPHTVEWDGRDDAGRECAAGVYFYRLSAGKETLSRKMVLLR